MQGDLLYEVLARALDWTIWGGDLVGAEYLQESGPAVFVSNHAAALGPIAVAASLPVRLHHWIVADMLDCKLAPPYLQKDFIGPVLHTPGWMSLPAARALSQVTVPLLRRLGCVPVWTDTDVLRTFALSEEYLLMGRNLVVFPENPGGIQDPVSGMRPFKTGFAALGHYHYSRTHKRLRFHPVAVRARPRYVRVGPAIEYNPFAPPARERERIARLLESAIRSMLVGEQGEVYGGVPHTP
jgi:1-acyl-sn-glycerol-3-phosphate acyltransferase